jgi:hypothetical protein
MQGPKAETSSPLAGPRLLLGLLLHLRRLPASRASCVLAAWSVADTAPPRTSGTSGVTAGRRWKVVTASDLAVCRGKYTNKHGDAGRQRGSPPAASSATATAKLPRSELQLGTSLLRVRSARDYPPAPRTRGGRVAPPSPPRMRRPDPDPPERPIPYTMPRAALGSGPRAAT